MRVACRMGGVTKQKDEVTMQEVKQDEKKQSFLKGAAILAAASIFVKIIGAVYRLPLVGVLGDAGYGYFQTTYNIYTLLLTISTAGIPVALSRLVSSAAARGDSGLVKRYFSVALPAFAAIGVAAMLVMFIFADSFAGFMNNSQAAAGIRVLAPAVFFGCIISVYRGYMQGFEHMAPTALSQVVEVISKAAIGLIIAMWLTRRDYDLPVRSAGAIMGVTVGLALCIPLLIRSKRKHDSRTALHAPGGSSGDAEALPAGSSVLGQLMKVCVPITLGASFMSIITVIDSSVVMGRLQRGLILTEFEASEFFGMYSKCLNIYQLPTALIVPVSVSIVPAIAAALARRQASEARIVTQSAIKLVNLLALPAAAGIMALSNPILTALFQDSRPTTATILTILGAASFFVCFQLVTTAILQANGFERIMMITYPVGGAVQIILDYYLVGNPSVGIIGSPIGTLSCFAVISALNILFMRLRIKERPKLGVAFIKPLFCTAVMAGTAYGVYALADRLLASALGGGRLAVVICLGAAICAGVIVYAALIILTRVITAEDLALVPKGEKLARVLRVRTAGAQAAGLPGGDGDGNS